MEIRNNAQLQFQVECRKFQAGISLDSEPQLLSILFRRGKNYRLFMVGASAAHPIARIKKGDIKHEPDEQNRETALDTVQDARADRSATENFDERQHNMASVQ